MRNNGFIPNADMILLSNFLNKSFQIGYNNPKALIKS